MPTVEDVLKTDGFVQIATSCRSLNATEFCDGNHSHAHDGQCGEPPV